MTLSDLRQHAGEDLQAKILFVPKAVRPALDDPDLGVDPLHEPQGELLLRLQYAAIPLQFRSTSAANCSNGLSRCHLSDSFQLSKNLRAHPSRRYPHNWSNDSLSRQAV